MDYLANEFGSFDPHGDPYAAARFAINCMLSEGRLEDLRELVTTDHDTGGVEGVPGWILERKDPSSDDVYYTDWPKWARFRAHVSPEDYQLGSPTCFMDQALFFRLVRAALKAYVLENPDERSTIEAITLNSDPASSS